MGLPTRSTSAGINKPRIGVIRQGRGPTSVALPAEALAAQRKDRNHVCRRDRKPAGPANEPSRLLAVTAPRPVSNCEKEILMSSPSTPMPTPEGPGSVSGAPNLPPGFADTFASLVPDGRTELREGYAEVGDVRLHYVEAGDGPL